jgi:diacylglycerol kinase (ATP)
MRHIFVINPKAGRVDRTPEISAKLKDYDGKLDYEIYVTKSLGDAQGYVRDYLKSHDPKETYRFYACGGDGTLYDVVNGAYGFPNAEVACLALGSGNDFVKNFHDLEAFRDLDRSIAGIAKKIDLLKVDDKVCINITNYGFDGEVTFAQLKYKRRPFMNGPRAYKAATLHCFLFKMNQPLKLTLDGKVAFDGKGLLVVIANGFCYGGGYYCAPNAKIDDGLIDVVLIKKVGKLKAAGFMKIFREGRHIESPKTKDLVIYQRCKKAIIESTKPVAYAIDGEVFRKQKVEVSILPLALSFVVPAAKN